MTDDAPRPLPIWFPLAASSPTLLLAVGEVSRELAGPTFPFTFAQLATIWTFLTVPLVLLCAGARRLIAAPGGVREEDVRAAIDAVGRAEVVAREWLAAAPLKPSPPRRARAPLALIALIVLLLGAGTAWGVAFVRSPPTEPVHIHVGFALYAEGERLRFDDPSFDFLQRRILLSHLHAPDDGTLHIEGPPGQTVADSLARAVGVSLDVAGATLDKAVHGGRQIEGARVFVLAPDDARWRETSIEYAPGDLDRILLTLGPSTQDALASQQASVPAPTASGAR
jgi:hypothetical protein